MPAEQSTIETGHAHNPLNDQARVVTSNRSHPLVVSFYCGDQYYYESAELLKADCQNAGIDYDIVELDIPKEFNWAQICKVKVEFYLEMLKKHHRPILWVDVDCRLLQLPSVLSNCDFDIVGFLRGFNYIRNFNSVESARLWSPSFLYFAYTARSLEFVELMVRISRDMTESVTDDFLLQEAWLTYDKMLNVGFLKPDLITRSTEAVTDETAFIFQASGNVSEWRSKVVQHDKLRFNPEFQAGVLYDVAMKLKAMPDAQQRAISLLEEATRLAPNEYRFAAHYAEQLKIAKRYDEAEASLAEFIERNPESLEARQKAVSMAIVTKRFEVADRLISDMMESEIETFRNYAKSARFDLSLETRATEKKIKLQDRTPLWWMKTPYPGNFGDILNPYLIEKMTGIPPRFVPRGKGMLAIGSVIKFAKSDTIVWGTGTPRLTDTLAADAKYHAVRGPLTRDLVLKSGGTCPEVYGDPALLLPRYYTPKTTKKFRLGFISHVVHRGRLSASEDVREISIIRCGPHDIETFIDEMNECEAILSTSLHGLIVAHAYGIPARWCTVSDAEQISGDGTKFLDYFMSIKMPPQEPLDLAHCTQVTLSMRSEVPDLVMSFDPEPLIAAFPFKISS